MLGLAPGALFIAAAIGVSQSIMEDLLNAFLDCWVDFAVAPLRRTVLPSDLADRGHGLLLRAI